MRRSPHLAIGLILLPILLLIGCQGRSRPRQVILITVDTLRADRLGCYGYQGETSPHIDAFAEEATLFRHVTCQAPWTIGSLASLMGGRASSEILPGPDAVLNQRIPFLAELASRAGLTTVAVIANPNVNAEIGFARGFDRFLELYLENPGPQQGKNAGSAGERPLPKGPKVTAEQVTDTTLELLQELKDRDFFLWILYLDPHTPYVRHPDEFYRGEWPPHVEKSEGEHMSLAWPKGVPFPPAEIDPEAETDGVAATYQASRRILPLIQHLYDGEVRYTDLQVGRLLDGLQELGLQEQALTILTADHGESLFDHENYFGHGAYPYQACSHVPLIVRWPGREPSVREEPSALVDLFPTILNHLELPLPEGSRGRLLPRDDGAEPVLLETLSWNDHALRQGRYKLIQWGGEHQRPISLFDLQEDPGELEDRAGEHPELVREMTAELDRITATLEPAPKDGPAPVFDPELAEQVRALGYLQ